MVVAFFSSFSGPHRQLVFYLASYVSWFSCSVIVLGHSHPQSHHQMIHIRLLALQEVVVAKQLVVGVGSLDRVLV